VQYIVYAHDHTDEHALERRMAIRPDHLQGVREMKGRGQFHLGGALLDEQGRMIGSMMLVEFELEEDLRAWLDVEPYIVEGVWERYEVKPFRMADV
jgi:uncharacterized protein YciI